MKDYREINRAMWDERVPIHVGSEFYDVAGFKAGRSTLQPFERDEMGPVDDARLVHLQCHFGLDTLSWARLGAKVTGLDFSQPAVEAGRRLAREVGIEARFVRADLYDAATALAEQFDIVYTGIGAITWLRDIRAWASVVGRLLRPGGHLYFVECHPLAEVFAPDSLEVVEDYFHDADGVVWDEPGTYADFQAATRVNRCIQFRHPIGDILGALLERGLRLEMFREHEHTAFARWPFLRRDPDGCYRMPPGRPRLPLLFSLRARKPT